MTTERKLDVLRVDHSVHIMSTNTGWRIGVMSYDFTYSHTEAHPSFTQLIDDAYADRFPRGGG